MQKKRITKIVASDWRWSIHLSHSEDTCSKIHAQTISHNCQSEDILYIRHQIPWKDQTQRWINPKYWVFGHALQNQGLIDLVWRMWPRAQGLDRSNAIPPYIPHDSIHHHHPGDETWQDTLRGPVSISWWVKSKPDLGGHHGLDSSNTPP